VAENALATLRLHEGILPSGQELERLAEFPGLGHRRADIGDPRYHFWAVSSYLIVCIPDTNPLQVIRVVSGYRDLPVMLMKK
jgi:plasmid stabilization system protein ParE